MGPKLKLKSFYTAKEIIKNKDKTWNERENICKWNNWQGINLQNIQKAPVAQYQKKKTISEKNTNQKMGGRPKQTFLQRRNGHTDGQEAHEKMFSLTNY